ncbi:MAG: NAD-dependent epimerase/dehydratase family protein [Elusimicrobia bacterium]|nr:NAD-dependent epimerase/dehydratase family protein [Elusimicrobiota bacterium]
MKRKVLICGSTGFIGRNIAETLADIGDYDVYGTYFKSEPLKNSKINMIKTDLTNNNDVKSVIKGMDIVIQAAATTSGAKEIVSKPYYHVTDNAIMNALIFRTACDYNISNVVFLSCTTMYQSSDFPVKETDFNANDEINPSYFGGAWTKVYNEKMCEFYSRIGSTKYTVLRHSNIYGPFDKYDLEKSHVFGATITKVMTAKEGGKIIVWGDGNEERDLLFISDLVDFIKIAIKQQKNKYEIFNVGYGSAISVGNLVKKIIKYSGNNIRIEYDLSKPSIKTKICLDISKVKDLFGWLPKVSLDDGINKTIKWYRNYFKLN